MQSTGIRNYQEYANKIGNRKALYTAVTEKYRILSALYPGSHIDIAPSFVIPKVTYVDSFRGTISFFKQRAAIMEYVAMHKNYEDLPDLTFLGQDYTQQFPCDPVDLIISQYGGFVVQATKHLLKIGGIALCNDSHGDATLTRFDEDFELVGVVDVDNTIKDTDLGQYFTVPKGKTLDLPRVRMKMQGLKYVSVAENYLFKKIR